MYLDITGPGLTHQSVLTYAKLVAALVGGGTLACFHVNEFESWCE